MAESNINKSNINIGNPTTTEVKDEGGQHVAKLKKQTLNLFYKKTGLQELFLEVEEREEREKKREKREERESTTVTIGGERIKQEFLKEIVEIFGNGFKRPLTDESASRKAIQNLNNVLSNPADRFAKWELPLRMGEVLEECNFFEGNHETEEERLHAIEVVASYVLNELTKKTV